MDIERLKKVTTIQEFFQITNKGTISEGIFGSDEGGTDSFRAGYCDIWAGKR